MTTVLVILGIILYLFLGIIVAGITYKVMGLRPSNSYGNNQDGAIVIAGFLWPGWLAIVAIGFTGWFLIFGFLRAIRITAGLVEQKVPSK